MNQLLVLSTFLYFCFSQNDDPLRNITLTSKSKVEMYTALFWTPCNEAKALLQSRGIDFETHLITLSRKNVAEMAKRTGGKTFVPQILVDDSYFGGLTELKSYYKTVSPEN